MSNSKQIENILMNLIKNGDKETIGDVIQLLELVSTFKKESKFSSKPQERPRRKLEEDEEYISEFPKFKNHSDHASVLLGMMSDNPRVPTQYLYRSSESYQGIPSRPSAAEFVPDDDFDPSKYIQQHNLNHGIVPQVNDMTTHADALL